MILYTLVAMKTAIHPVMHADAKTKCSSCSALYLIPSTVKEQSVETCRACPPIYTGKQQKDLKGGRVERFRKRMAAGKQEK